MSGLLAVAAVEVRRLLRSKLTLTLLIVIPALQLILFGYAIRPGGGTIAVAVAADSPAAIAAITTRIAGQRGIRLVPTDGTLGAAGRAVRAGAATIGIDVPPQRSLANPFAPILPVRITVDDLDSATAAAALDRIRALYWEDAAERATGGPAGQRIEIARLYNPQARKEWAFAPSLVGVTVMIAMILLGTLGIAREREGGTWEVLATLPLGRAAILGGKALPAIAIGAVQGLLVLGVAVLLFDLPARGSVVALIALLPLFAAAHLALGFVLSLRATAQIDALQGAVAVYLPAMLLSGFLYPFQSLPPWAQAIGNIFPLTHFVRAANGALLRGDGAATVLAHGVPIAVFLIVAGGIALAMPVRPTD